MIKLIIYAILIQLTLSLMNSCKPADFWYGEYRQNGEVYYPGRIDSLSILPGNQRAILRFRATTDPQVTYLKVYLRNSLSANQTFSVHDLRSGDHGQIQLLELPNLAEATYTANVFSFTAQGDSSRAVTASRFVYGNRYINTLTNRPYSTINRKNPDEHFLVFSREPNLPRLGLFYPMQFTEITYTDRAGATKTVTTTPYNDFVSLADAARPSIIRYRTAYKPVATSIDLFYTDYNDVAYD